MRNETFQESIRFIVPKLTPLNYDSWYFSFTCTELVCSNLWINIPIGMTKPVIHMLADCKILFNEFNGVIGRASKIKIEEYWKFHLCELKERLILWTIKDPLETP